MTDRELLELAAKAAGIKLHVWGADGRENFADMDARPYGKLWNPLVDDGDAFRLAAYLDLFSGPGYWHHLVIVRLSGNTDKYANVRRAIVRLAAEIGKQMAEPSKWSAL